MDPTQDVTLTDCQALIGEPLDIHVPQEMVGRFTYNHVVACVVGTQ